MTTVDRCVELFDRWKDTQKRVRSTRTNLEFCGAELFKESIENSISPMPKGMQGERDRFRSIHIEFKRLLANISDLSKMDISEQQETTGTEKVPQD